MVYCVPVSVREILHRKRKDILRLAEESGARNVRVFGSVVRGEEKLESDVDFLVTMDADKSLFDIMHLEEELTDLLHRKAQVLTDDGLNCHFRPYILREAVSL